MATRRNKSFQDIQVQRMRILDALESRRVANFGTTEGARIANRMDRVRKIGDRYIRNIKNTKSFQQSENKANRMFNDANVLNRSGEEGRMRQRLFDKSSELADNIRNRKYSQRTYMGKAIG